MSKLLLLLLIAVVVVGAWWLSRRRISGPREVAPKLQAMAPCAHCGVHVPANDAVMRDEQVYCSPAHRDLGPKQSNNSRG